MAYWWVSQNKTSHAERRGGYLWAPKSGKDGVVFHHWSNMTLVQPGDIIFSYADRAVGAVGIASSSAYDAPQPVEFANTWNADGRRVDVSYQLVNPSVALQSFVDDLLPLLSGTHSPITKNKTGVQGYLFNIPPKAGELICERIGASLPVDQLIATGLRTTVPDSTTYDALVKARIGQGRWRQDLLRYWSGKCAVTGLDVAPLLKASHIKPWRDSDNRERLDIFNGFILSATFDAAFDAGLITFSEVGTLVVSTGLTRQQCEAAGLQREISIRGLRPEHHRYLAHHRNNRFVA